MASSLLSASSSHGTKWLRSFWYSVLRLTASSNMVVRESDAVFSLVHRSVMLSSFSSKFSLSDGNWLFSFSSFPSANRAA